MHCASKGYRRSAYNPLHSFGDTGTACAAPEVSPTPAQPPPAVHHVTAADLAAMGLHPRTAKRWHRSAVASGEYLVATVETLTSTGARREARALVMDAETLAAVRETIAGRRG